MTNLQSKVYQKNIYKNIDFDRERIINSKTNILPLGSCFLDIFAYHLQKENFNILSNPHKTKSQYFQLKFDYGNFYNPLNLLDNLQRIIQKKWKFNDDDY